MSTRPYRQQARADSASRTRVRILEAAMALALEKATTGMSLGDIAERAGVSVQTVLRRFGTRDALMDEAISYGEALISAERRPSAPDVPSAIGTLFDHYESRGDAVIRLLAQEAFDERIARITESGRREHRRWVARFLAAAADVAADAGAGSAADEALVDQLVVVTDVYAWKLLRRDRGRSRDVAQQRVTDMVTILRAAGMENRGGPR